MSFVRAGREIETLDAFARSKRDQLNGLGKWPLLQSYTYYWGIEVAFGPEFDDVFGISVDKQRVRPIEDFWRLLTKRNIDDLLRNENAWQSKTRATEHKKRLADKAKSAETATPSEAAAAAVPVIPGKRSMFLNGSSQRHRRTRRRRRRSGRKRRTGRLAKYWRL